MFSFADLDEPLRLLEKINQVITNKHIGGEKMNVKKQAATHRSEEQPVKGIVIRIDDLSTHDIQPELKSCGLLKKLLKNFARLFHA